MRTRLLLVLALPCALGSCDHYEDLDENPDCSLPGEPALDPALQDGAPTLIIGEPDASDGAFVTWADDDVVSARYGSQGAVMLAPTLRLADQGARAERCLHVRFTASGPEEASISNAFEFSEDAGDLVAGPIFIPLSGTDFDDDFDVRAVVSGELYQSVAEVRVHLVGAL
ncbi:MAG: hypothetical protein H6713_01040 [Myxococcales bacterium]|nr:hypothetical protein [Myxococcales bacterium]MCB9748568.1 hypothetical protein [Myxococcales bacterium]